MFPSTRGWAAWNALYAGKEAGALRPRRDITVSIYKRRYLAHRLIWLHVHGKWPRYQIDHIDGDRANNRLNNLRSVTNLTNHRNMPLKRHNTSGVAGVTWSNRDKRWIAQIGVRGKNVLLGYFKDKDAAIDARKRGERTYRFHLNSGRPAISA